MSILFYYPSNKRTISIESVIIGFKNQGHHVILLTQSEESELHEELHKDNIDFSTYVIEKNNALVYYFKHLLFLIKFCRINKIDIVYSHLQQANIISVFAQYFCKSIFYICRHHSSVSGSDKNFNQSLFDKLINHFSKLIIVPSKMVYKQVNEVEGVSYNKIKLINYGYDFNKYPLPNIIEVEKIKNDFKSKLLLVKIARLVPGKRFDILFSVINKLVKEGMDIKLLVISGGPLFNELETYIKDNYLESNIYLLGEKLNVIDYLSASDVVPLLSEAEASNSVIKEAGLVNKCVIVCKGVGDFEDYIVSGESGLLMDKENPMPDLINYLSDIYNEKINIENLGLKLHESVINNFSIENVLEKYASLNK
jgi:glycosyltransferase involved in cell wall biosynthesis